MKNKEKPPSAKGSVLSRTRPHSYPTKFPAEIVAGTPKIYPTKFPTEIRRGPRKFTPRKILRILRGDPCAEWALTQLFADLPHRKYFRRGPRNLPHAKSCGFYAGTPVPSPEGNIRMKNKEKPLPQKGAYLVVRDRIAERALTQLLADLPHRKYFRRGPRRALS